LITLSENQKLIWQPDALADEPAKQGKQFAALQSPADILGLYGGKDSGKSDLLIFDCLYPHKLNSPRWHGVIFRREYKRLIDVIDRAHFWIEQLPHLGATWQGSPNFRFLFPSGAWLAFHNIEHLGDEEKYQGWQITDLKFDQLDEFLEPMYNFLLLQNRKADLSVKETTRWTANPLGVGHTWIKNRYIKRYDAGTLNEISAEVNGVRYAKTFQWLHFTVFDNPVAKRDPSRIATLALEQNETRRRAMLMGDPDVAAGQFFHMFDTDKEVVAPFRIPPEWDLTLSIDPGWGGTCSAGLHAKDFDGNIYRIATYYNVGGNNYSNAEGVLSFWKTNKYTDGKPPNMIIAGRDAFAKKDEHAIIQNQATFASIFQEYGMTLLPAVTDRVNGWGTLTSLMPGRFFVFRDFNKPFLEELYSAPQEEGNPNEIKGKGKDPSIPDHALDECRYNVMAQFTPNKAVTSSEPPWFQEELAKIERQNNNSGWRIGEG
jgi:hypothetical protein